MTPRGPSPGVARAQSTSALTEARRLGASTSLPSLNHCLRVALRVRSSVRSMGAPSAASTRLRPGTRNETRDSASTSSPSSALAWNTRLRSRRLALSSRGPPAGPRSGASRSSASTATGSCSRWHRGRACSTQLVSVARSKFRSQARVWDTTQRPCPCPQCSRGSPRTARSRLSKSSDQQRRHPRPSRLPPVPQVE